jgi:inosose dehydratase
VILPVGVNPSSWSNNVIADFGGDTPLETCLADARAAGYSGIELGYKFPSHADALKPLLAAHHLRLISGWYGSRLRERSAREEIAAMQPYLDLLITMDCKIAIFADMCGAIYREPATPISQRPILSPSEWSGYCAKLSDMGRHLRDHGIALAYHHHAGSFVENEEEILRLIEGSSAEVGLLIDAGHLAYGGVDILRLTRRLAERVVHVHCKDVRAQVLEQARAQDWSFINAVRAGVFTIAGDGAIDFAALVGELRQRGYRGWLINEAEQDPKKADPAVYARKAFDYLARLAA